MSKLINAKRERFACVDAIEQSNRSSDREYKTTLGQAGTQSIHQ